MQVDHGRQRSQQRPGFTDVHLEAGAREREVSPAIVQDHLTWPVWASTSRALVGASLGLVASVKEWPLGTMMQSPRREPHRRFSAVDQQPAGTGRHGVALDRARLVADASWVGQEDVQVLGPEQLSHRDLADIVSDIVGWSVRYRRVSFAELVRADGSRAAVKAVSGIIQETYFQETTVGGDEVVRYLPAIRLEDELGTAEPVVPYLYSPGFVQAYASAWLAPAQMAALARAEPAFLLRLREEGSWEPFQAFFHGVLVRKLSAAIRTRFDATGSHGTTLADMQLGLNGALKDEVAGLLPLFDAIPGAKLARAALERVLGSKPMARYAANVGHPEVGRFFGDVSRMLDVFAAHGGREAMAAKG